MTIRTSEGLLFGAVVLAVFAGGAGAQEQARVEPPSKPVFVSEPVVPTATPAVRDLPDWKPDPNVFGLEMKRREDFGFIPIEYAIKPKVDPLLELQSLAAPPQPDAFSTLIHNFAGQTSTSSPPDTTGDVGPSHFVQATNQSVSTVRVLDKNTGANLKTFTMQSLASSSPCNSGFCDPVVLYDRVADRWIISELPSSGGNVCVYVSQTADPTGAWWAYTFAVESSVTDYPKYGVWPQNGNGGSYLIGVNAGSGSNKDIFALDRAKMLAGQPASFQKFSVASLPNSGFQLVLPSAMQGGTPPPNGEPAVFIRPHDDEAQNGASTPTYDLLDMWTLSVDWTTPANSVLTQLTSLHIGDYDMTLCGLGTIWNCMPQPGTTQKIDPIREPLHFPLHYRNFGDHQTLVGTFVEDVDGTDHAALRWFELRKTGAGAWSLFQEGLVGGEANVHRSVGSIAMDGSGNIAIGYTRTGTAAPYYPSIYYKGRLASDTPGTMPQGEYPIQDGTFSKTGDERWGDYAGMSIDPADDCTFWFTTEYMTSNSSVATKVAAFKFDACGCLAVPPAPGATASVPQDNRIDVGWNDSATASIVQYLVFRATVAGGPYTQIATVSDSSPGVANGPSYTYHDDTVSGGTRYYYVVKSTDGVSCVSTASAEVNALATGACLLAPTFAGLTSVTNPGSSTCTLSLGWTAGSSVCSAGVIYNVYRSITSGFTPAPANQIASGLSGTSYVDAVGIATGTTYYYVVRAVDSGNGVEETNTTQKSGVPTGAIATTSWTDTFEGALSGGGFDQAGWTHTAVSGTTNWVWSTVQPHDGTHTWFAQDWTSASDKVLVSPSFGVLSNTTLSFWHTYAFESTTTCYDGGTLEYSTDGATWTVVPAADFTAGAYTGTVNGGNASIGGKPAWCGGTIGAMTQVAVNLGGDANLVGKTLQIRWHEGDDVNTAVTGWYVDTAAVSNAGVAGTCATGTGCTAPGAPTLTSATGDCGGVNLTWSAGTGTTASYNVYRSTTPGGPYTLLGSFPTTAGTTYTDTTAVGGTTYGYVVRGACAAGGTGESGNSNELSAARLASPIPTITGASTNACPATTVVLTTQSGKSDYQWYLGGSPIGGATSDTYTATASGTYTVSYANASGCSGTSAGKTVSIVACVPNIVYQSHGTITQVTGDGDAFYERGEKWSVSVTVANNGNMPASNVMATLGGNGIAVCAPTASFGSIAPGATGTATFEFVISPTFTPCGGAIGFNVTNKTSTELTPAGPDQSGVFNVPVGQQVTGSATELVIQPATGDTYVNLFSTGTNYGTATTMLTNVRTSREEDLLVQFDLSGIPAGSTINSATLELYNTTAPFSTYALNVHRNTATWSETAVTWTTKPAYDATIAAQITPTAAAGWKIWTVTSAVQGWSGGAYANYGFTVRPNAPTGTTSVVYTFATRENSTTSQRPILRVNYTPLAWDCSTTGSGSCCAAPTGPANSTALDLDLCADTGVQISWAQDPSDWADGGVGTRTYDVLRDGSAIASGIGYGTTSFTDTTGVNGTSYTYTVRYRSGCGGEATTAGANASDGAPVCAAVDSCHDAGTCDPGTGTCSTPAKADGTSCDDGNACTQSDTCQSGACAAGSAVPGPGLTDGLGFSDPTTLSWSAAAGATAYDVIRGTLSALAGGGFLAATDACLGNDVSSTSISDGHVPAAGDADWFLVRAHNSCGTGTYDDGTLSLVVPRDAGIAASTSPCP